MGKPKVKETKAEGEESPKTEAKNEADEEFNKLCKALVDFKVENTEATQRIGMPTNVPIIGISLAPSSKNKPSKLEINIRLPNGELIRTSDLDMMLKTIEENKEKLWKIHRAIQHVNSIENTPKKVVELE